MPFACDIKMPGRTRCFNLFNLWLDRSIPTMFIAPMFDSLDPGQIYRLAFPSESRRLTSVNPGSTFLNDMFVLSQDWLDCWFDLDFSSIKLIVSSVILSTTAEFLFCFEKVFKNCFFLGCADFILLQRRREPGRSGKWISLCYWVMVFG